MITPPWDAAVQLEDEDTGGFTILHESSAYRLGQVNAEDTRQDSRRSMLF